LYFGSLRLNGERNALRVVAWLEKGIDQNTADCGGVEQCDCGKRMVDEPLGCDHEQQDLSVTRHRLF
jgi:hypothetical protein